MGLDITLTEYFGINEKGYLVMETPDEEDWDSSRVSIRHKISANIDFDTLSSGKKYDIEEYYRPSNFEEAYKWAETLEDGEKEYIKNILEILQKNNNYYLNYGY